MFNLEAYACSVQIVCYASTLQCNLCSLATMCIKPTNEHWNPSPRSYKEYISSFVVSYTLLSMGCTLNSRRYNKNEHMDYTLHLYYTLETH